MSTSHVHSLPFPSCFVHSISVMSTPSHFHHVLSFPFLSIPSWFLLYHFPLLSHCNPIVESFFILFHFLLCHVWHNSVYMRHWECHMTPWPWSLLSSSARCPSWVRQLSLRQWGNQLLLPSTNLISMNTSQKKVMKWANEEIRKTGTSGKSEEEEDGNGER